MQANPTAQLHNETAFLPDGVRALQFRSGRLQPREKQSFSTSLQLCFGTVVEIMLGESFSAIISSVGLMIAVRGENLPGLI